MKWPGTAWYSLVQDGGMTMRIKVNIAIMGTFVFDIAIVIVAGRCYHIYPCYHCHCHLHGYGHCYCCGYHSTRMTRMTDDYDLGIPLNMSGKYEQNNPFCQSIGTPP